MRRVERTVRIRGPIDLALTFRPLRHGFSDPTIAIGEDGVTRATRTPDGPASMRIAADREAVRVTTWGPGAAWVAEHAPDLLGFGEDPDAFRPHHRLLHQLHRRFRGVRMPRTGVVLEALVPAILEQKVVGKEARRSYARLVRRFGEPAPGPLGLTLPPAPETLASTPYYELHPLGIERRRADLLRVVGARAGRLEEATRMSPEDAEHRLRAVRGIGPWTAGEVRRVALGDPDAVSVGDYHLPSIVAWALAGEPRADDARMLELLEPYRGRRARAILLIEASGLVPPRLGPRRRLRAIERI